MKQVRTRFSPSPTGFQHIGGFRTAFFAWLLGRHYGGKCLLRVEDTDQERLVPGSARFLIEELQWLGVIFDEGPGKSDLAAINEDWDGAPDLGGPVGPYIQSRRLARYKQVAEQLIAGGFAYRCDCTPEMIERERLDQMARKETPGYSGYCRNRNVGADTKHVVRFKMPHNRSVVLNDAVKGRVVWDDIPLRDMVLLKSDGFPTYHLAVVADDHDMQISHVMRGDEWLSTAPLHVLLYEALGWEQPIFAHLPTILGSDGKKLSKRRGAQNSKELREQGYLPEAILNYVVLIGWSPGEGEEQEIFTKDELIKRFSLERVNNASGVFDIAKLTWMNGLYIRKLPLDEFTARVRPYIEKAGLSFRADRWAPVAPLVQERLKLLTEAAPMVDFLFVDTIQRDMPSMFDLKKGLDAQKARQILLRALEELDKTTEWSVPVLEAALRPLADEFGLKVGPLFGVLRVAVTGKKVTPPLFESFVALGREDTLKRMRETVPLLEA